MRKCNSHKTAKETGNVLIYVLIGILLIGALTLALSRQGEQADSQDISDETAQLYALDILEYAQAAQSVITQMEITGTNLTDFDFVIPSEAAFNTAPHIHKVFHPQGGGLTYKELAGAVAQTGTDPTAGYYVGRFNNIEWTKSTTDDIVFAAYRLPENLCSLLNQKITGSSTIPAVSGGFARYIVPDAYHSTANEDLDVADCAGCEGYPQLCVSNAGVTVYAFYAILSNE